MHSYYTNEIAVYIPLPSSNSQAKISILCPSNIFVVVYIVHAVPFFS